MSWDYRVMKRKFERTEEIQYAIYEAYYNKNDEIISWSSEPLYIAGEDLKELKQDLALYIKAFEKPVLDYNELEEKFRKK